jgi:cell wall-associated NlpC family hydrolase
VSLIAGAAYRGGRTSMITAMLKGDSPQTVIDQMGALDQVSRDQEGAIEALKKAKKPYEALQKKLDAEIKVQATQEKVLRDRKAALNKDLAKWKALNAKLKPRASRSGGASGPPPVYDGPAQGRARTVVQFAHAQLGKPYVFGADGPGSYDCSGLTLAAWRQVGVSLPHSSRQQLAQSAKVSRASLQPGDLVFFYPDTHHVGIYIGNGKVIHAPTEGQNVKIAGMDTMPVSGYARPS